MGICIRCKATLMERVGKYGPFYYCPNSTPTDSHPTFKKPYLRTAVANNGGNSTVSGDVGKYSEGYGDGWDLF